MNNKGQLAGYEAVIILVLLIVSGVLVWLLISKKTESNIYQSGSKPVEFHPEAHFGGCASTKVMEYLEAKHNGTLTSISNSVAN